MLNDYNPVQFRVGISGDSFDGYYYITWSILETPIISDVYMYATPSKLRYRCRVF